MAIPSGCAGAYIDGKLTLQDPNALLIVTPKGYAINREGNIIEDPSMEPRLTVSGSLTTGHKYWRGDFSGAGKGGVSFLAMSRQISVYPPEEVMKTNTFALIRALDFTKDGSIFPYFQQAEQQLSEIGYDDLDNRLQEGDVRAHELLAAWMALGFNNTLEGLMNVSSLIEREKLVNRIVKS
jgi:hypothetical protein